MVNVANLELVNDSIVFSLDFQDYFSWLNIHDKKREQFKQGKSVLNKN